MLSNLNEQQKQAVLATEGPVMVFAGAGTGKTRTLTYRVAYMIDKVKIKPTEILAITFTNKATNEMKSRLISLIGSYSNDITISTFHSLCARILRRDIVNLDYTRYFSILDEEEQLKIVNEVLKENNFDKKKYPGRQIQRMIKHHKNFNTLPEELDEKKIFNLYEERTKELNLLDFDDLLLKTYELFEKNPEILKRYANIFKYILVDEFQDTNLIQYKMLKMLAFEGRNLFVVGDDDQGIYGFRGANHENVQLFKEDFPEYKMFFLTENYRSPQSILDGCNRLISNNLKREEKELFSSQAGEASDVVIFQALSEQYEVDYILDQITSLKAKNISFKEMAVLYRSSVLLRNIELGFVKSKIPYKVYGGVPYLRRREIKDVIAYLKLVVDNNDIYSFKRIVNVPSRLIGEQTINKILDIKKKYKIPLFEALDSSKSILSKKRYETLIWFKELILELREMLETDDLITVFEHLLEKIEYRKYLEAEDGSSDRLDNIEEFKSILLELEEDSTELSRVKKLQEAFDQALLNDDIKQNQREDREGVTLSTIHSIKGLEYEYVFVIGLEENVFPNSRKNSEPDELEEERRIAYVAFTRAKKRLYLLASKSRLLYGDRFINKPSRFMIEFVGADTFSETREEEIPFREKSRRLLSKEEQPNYNLSDKVIHQNFGVGIIIAIKDDIAQIFFDDSKELKSIMLNHSALNKLNDEKKSP